MSRAVAMELIEKFTVSTHNTVSNKGGIQKISEEAAILSFLWFAGNKCGIRDVSVRFGIAESTFFRYCERVLNFLIEMAPSVIQFPKTPAEKKNLTEKFQEISGFPDVLGCVNGTCIPIATPAGKMGKTYVNNHTISVGAQAICSYDLKFLDVFTGPPIKIPNSLIFKLSPISKKAEEICQGKFHLLGDATYPISPFLLTPYRRDESVSAMEVNYNNVFNTTRMTIENAFGKLKQRFRQLRYLEFHSVDKVSKFIISCCVLHNLCIDAKDTVEFDDDSECDVSSVSADENDAELSVSYTNPKSQNDKHEGEAKRDRIAAALFIS